MGEAVAAAVRLRRARTFFVLVDGVNASRLKEAPFKNFVVGKIYCVVKIYNSHRNQTYGNQVEMNNKNKS